MVDDEKESEKRHERQSPENIKEILGVVSAEVPSLIKNILGSVFSEEAGRNMGKAAAAYYKELKNGGLPEAVAVKLTEDYMRTFTSLGDMLRNAGSGRWSGKAAGDIGEEVKRKIHEGLEKKGKEGEEEEEE
ncbi:MAG TPA: hypothetical protein VEC97_05025 [Candidatus Acidoferrales bacterium]|nr:hypothetical protein [Candidatus Acidoferrales bacterium]